MLRNSVVLTVLLDIFNMRFHRFNMGPQSGKWEEGSFNNMFDSYFMI